MKNGACGVLMVVAIASGAGCDESPVASTQGSSRPVAPAPTTTIAQPISLASNTAPTPPGVVRPPNVFTDGQIMSVLAASNAKEVEVSKVVAERTKNADIKAFAEMMVTHHGDAKKKLDELGTAPGKPEAAPEADQMKEATRAGVERFRNLSGAELDRGYIDSMVRDHSEVLGLVTTRMLPVVANANLKTLLKDDLAPTIEKHLERAKELATKMGSSAAAGAQSSSAAPAPSPTGVASAGASAPAPKPAAPPK